MKKFIIFSFLFIILLSFSLGATTSLNDTSINFVGVHKLNTSYISSGAVSGATECQLMSVNTPTSSIYPNDTYVYNITLINSTFSLFNINISNLFFQERGNYLLNFRCSGAPQIDPKIFVRELYVTENGNDYNNYTVLVSLVLLIFFCSLVVGLYIIKKHIDFEKWYNRLLSKYETRNFIKVALGSMLYVLMKNTYVIYYLIGLPIISLITEISLTFNIESMILFAPVISFIYTFGIILIGALFFSNVQEWIIDLFKQFSDLDWGFKDDK